MLKYEIVILHFEKLINPHDEFDPLRLQVTCSALEQNISPEEKNDPLDDRSDMVVPGLIHRYPNKALWLVTEKCAMQCRFCFRKNIKKFPNCLNGLDDVFNYLQEHDEVNELIFSGGDPLTLPTSDFLKIKEKILHLESIKIWRFHTRLPIFDPIKVDENWLKILEDLIQADKKVVVVFHINHPREISNETKELAKKLIELGVTVKAQGVLLKGVNDSVKILQELWETESVVGIEPYYLHQLDRAPGTSHFLVDMEQGLELYSQALNNCQNLISQPKYIIDLGSQGKMEVRDYLKNAKSKN
ncbi:MAG: KamA family radical SAM protein [Pseudomonadales bacterium]|jgi:lysine 2,3-aminomutase|nr:KamA family radical SAM protein [Pseudomonadales bacterium]